jgi:Leucine-rich repeat (LRR) protein
MSKRDKKMSVLNTLNRLNEEDENALTQAEEEKRRLEEEKINSLNEYALEKLKLKDTIDGVFKVLPYCAPASVNLNDASRLESLEQLLIDQLILKQNNNNAGEQNDSNKPKSVLKQHSNYLSPSEYGSYLSSNAFNKNSPFYQQTSGKADNDIDNEKIEKLDLNKLNLNNDCLKLFSIDNLIGLHTPTPPPPPSNEDETEFKGSEEDSLNDETSSQKTAPPTLSPPLQLQNQESNKTENENNDFKNPEHFSLMKNSSKIQLLNLSQNNLTHLPPVSLLGMFNNLEYIDLSENMFESIHLVSLIRFKSLKGINLSGNMLKAFKAIDNSMENASSSLIDDALDDFYQENVNKLASTLFLTVERINLSNNQLKSQSCLLISQFKNLKYLNLSNNNFQITSTSVETQLPWQKSMSQLKNLIELNLSKNNKSVSSAKSAGQPQLVISPLPTIMPQQKSFRADSELSNVSKLSYAGGLNQALNKSFNALVNLRILDLSENNLHNMPADIKDLKNLEDLNFNSNFLHFIPNELTELRLLKRLSLRDNCITELNENFCTYSRFRDVLVRLDLSKNQLSNDTLTYKIALFESLKELDLSDNRFEAIPNTLPIHLVELNMNNNKIKTLMIRPLSQAAKSDAELLKALNINLVKKDETIQKKSAVEREVEKLLVNQKRPNTTSTKTEEAIFNETIYDQPDVDQSEEMSLPHVFYLRQLKCLRLRDNHLLDVPADFGILNSNLEYFDLANNMLTQVSVSLCRGLGFLKYLNLTSNRIRELTDKLRELSELEYLNLSFNRLTSLNYELCNDLRNLKELYLNNNNLETLPSFGLNKRNKENTDINTNNNDENPGLPFGRSTSSLSNTRVSAFGKRKNFFTFSLPNLVKIDLSNNKFKQSFSLYSAFALASKLVEINLSANKITFIDIDFSSVGSGNLSSAAIVNESNVKLAVDLAHEQRKSMNDDDKVKKISTPKYKLNNLKLVNLSNNDMIFNKGIFLLIYIMNF